MASSKGYDVAIVGAGPYGLSSAAHLKVLGMDVRVFGEPMEFWANGTPTGMLLRSPREASTISDPKSALTLEEYERVSGTTPVKRLSRDTFVDYGKWFHTQLGSVLDRRNVTRLCRDGNRFKLFLTDGEEVTADRVVVATGIAKFKTVPAPFANLSAERASHCYDGRPFSRMGKRVAVIGAGQSAIESAALLGEAGHSVELIAKIPVLRWIGMHQRLHRLGPISKMLYSKHDIGPIGISRLVAYPNLMYHFPLTVKDPIRKRAVRAAGAPWLIPRLPGVTITTSRSVVSATEVGGELQLKLDDGTERRVDHVLSGTGYRVDISKYEFLCPSILKDIQQLDGYPDVSAGFTTSVPGLHFTGATAARKFGPLLYFVTGTDFASRELASYFRRHRS
ncbi:MAG TPA: FAD-dependent oxidoreductase [Terracidiphilus sp.]|jgi:lysine/ornithine N-monooxygenase